MRRQLAFETGGGLDAGAQLRQQQWIGRQIGPYKLLGVLGSGGMGQVFRAAREDGTFDRDVAIKISTLNPLSASANERFAREENILARMDHPYIAAIYDAGVVEEGWPYFVMALVEGEDIASFAKQRSCSVTEVVALMIKVVEAVAYAHANLVVHRDLKPSNILVEADGTPKLLDFGIAKLLEGDVDHRTQTLALTPGYASPEQLLDEPITIASDIYQLGLVLHTLALGEPAFGYPSHSQALTQALERRPYQMSSSLRSKIPRDLSAIIETCLQADLNKRYRDANQLLMDLERFRTNRPVSARPVSVGYRIAKYARRNRAISAASLIFAVSVLTGSVGYTVQINAARDLAETQRLAADVARQDAETVTQFLSDTLAAADPGIDDKEVRVREVIDRAVATLDEGLSEQPRVQARLRATIGSTYQGLGLYPQALRQFELALALYEQLPGVEAAQRLELLGEIVWLKRESGDQEEALKLSQDVYQQWLDAYGEDHPQALSALDDVAKNYVEMGRFSDARPLFEQVLEARLETVGAEHLSTAVAMGALGDFFWQSGELDKSLGYFEQAFQLKRQLLGADHPDTLVSMGNLTAVKRMLGDTAGAIATRREMLEIQRESLGEEHPHTVITMTNLAISLDPLPQHVTERELLLRDAVAISERTLGVRHARTLYALHGLGTILREHGKLAESAGLYQDLVPAMSDVFGTYDLWTLRAIRSYGSTLCHQRRYRNADAQFERFESLVPADYLRTHRLWQQLDAAVSRCSQIRSGDAQPNQILAAT